MSEEIVCPYCNEVQIFCGPDSDDIFMKQELELLEFFLNTDKMVVDVHDEPLKQVEHILKGYPKWKSGEFTTAIAKTKPILRMHKDTYNTLEGAHRWFNLGYLYGIPPTAVEDFILGIDSEERKTYNYHGLIFVSHQDSEGIVFKELEEMYNL